VTDNIRIMTQYEINKLQNDANVPVYGTFEHVSGFEAEIALGSGNKDDLRTIQTINHETVHETLTKILNREISFLFDRGLFYNFESCKNGNFAKNTIIRETLIAFFTLTETETLI